MAKLEKTVNSESVKKELKDMQEAAGFGCRTPGFLINGVPVKGTYPFNHFKVLLKS